MNSAITNTTIWHDGVAESSLMQTRPFQVSSSQVSVPENASSQISSTQVSISEISHIETGVVKSSFSEVGIGQISNIKIGILQARTSEIGTSQIGTIQTGLEQPNITQIDFLQNRPFKVEFIHTISTQVNTPQVNTIQYPFQFKSSEITLPSSISLNQFFPVDSFHNSTPQIISELHNTAANIWSNRLTSGTPVEIDLQIKNLSTGQLAFSEALR